MSDQDSISARINQAFRTARLNKDEATKTVIGMLRSKVLLETKGKDAREEDDALWLDVLGAYAKQLRKTIAEFEKVGDAGAEHIKEASFELTFCEGFLPQKLDAAQTEALVSKLAAEHGINEPKGMGRLMGLVMKDHREQVDGDLVRKAATAVLSGS